MIESEFAECSPRLVVSSQYAGQWYIPSSFHLHVEFRNICISSHVRACQWYAHLLVHVQVPTRISCSLSTTTAAIIGRTYWTMPPRLKSIQPRTLFKFMRSTVRWCPWSNTVNESLQSPKPGVFIPFSRQRFRILFSTELIHMPTGMISLYPQTLRCGSQSYVCWMHRARGLGLAWDLPHKLPYWWSFTFHLPTITDRVVPLKGHSSRAFGIC